MPAALLNLRQHAMLFVAAACNLGLSADAVLGDQFSFGPLGSRPFASVPVSPPDTTSAQLEQKAGFKLTLSYAMAELQSARQPASQRTDVGEIPRGPAAAVSTIKAPGDRITANGAPESAGGVDNSAGSARTVAPGTSPDAGAANLPNTGWNTPVPAARPNVPAAIQSGYLDQLLGGATADPPEDALIAGVQPFGRRAGSLLYRVDAASPSSGASTIEQGLALRYSQETESMGAFDLTLTARQQQGSVSLPGASAGGIGRLTLAQSGFALNNRWLMDNTIGVLPGLSAPLLNGGYRVSLPSSLLQGVQSRVYDENREFSIVTGKPGSFTGVNGFGFDTGSASLSGVGGGLRLDPATRIAAQLWTLSRHATVPNHTTLALAGERRIEAGSARIKPILVIDDRGKTGVWIDGEWSGFGGNQRGGFYRSAPGLLWTDLSIVNDQQGAYWRTDWRGLLRSISVGTEVTESNLARDPARSATRALSGFASGSWRISRDLTLGGGATAKVNRPPVASLAPVNSVQLGVNAFAGGRLPIGPYRLGFSRQGDSGAAEGRSDVTTLRWDQEWQWLPALRLATNAGVSVEKLPVIGTTERRDVGFAVSSVGAGRLFWDGSLAVSSANSQTASSTRSTNGAFNLNYAWEPGLIGSLSLFVNHTPPVGAQLAAVRPNDSRLMLLLRYEFAAGIPYQTTGLRGGGYGVGSIEGTVFFDENRDGIRQPNESAAANATVTLDQRHVTTTDSQGRFSFRLVPAGEHRIDLVRDKIPLPWELRDETLLRVTVNAREVARPMVSLTRID